SSGHSQAPPRCARSTRPNSAGQGWQKLQHPQIASACLCDARRAVHPSFCALRKFEVGCKQLQCFSAHGDVVLARAHLSERLSTAIRDEDTVPLKVSGADRCARYGSIDRTLKQVNFAPVAVSEDRLGGDLGIAKSCHEVSEAIRLQPVPEDLRQARRKSVEAAQVQAG